MDTPPSSTPRLGAPCMANITWKRGVWARLPSTRSSSTTFSKGASWLA